MTNDEGQIVDLPSSDRAAWRRSMETATRGATPAREVLVSPLPSGPLIVCESLVKIYKVADLEVVALQGLDRSEERRVGKECRL